MGGLLGEVFNRQLHHEANGDAVEDEVEVASRVEHDATADVEKHQREAKLAKQHHEHKPRLAYAREAVRGGLD